MLLNSLCNLRVLCVFVVNGNFHCIQYQTDLLQFSAPTGLLTASNAMVRGR
jgi:hypothetical protein